MPDLHTTCAASTMQQMPAYPPLRDVANQQAMTHQQQLLAHAWQMRAGCFATLDVSAKADD